MVSRPPRGKGRSNGGVEMRVSFSNFPMKILFKKALALFRKGKLDAEMAEEMHAHLEQQTEANIARGMSADEAHYAAQRQFGGLEQIKERARDQRGCLWLEQFFQDIRFAARGLGKARAFTLTAGLTLALGIGANTAIFSLVHAVILRPLPFPDPQRLMFVWNNNTRENIPDDLASWPTFEDWRGQNRTFARMAGYLPGNVDLTGNGEPEQVPSCSVSDAFFETLGISPLFGRPFSAEEQTEGKDDVAIIGYGLWQRRFGGDRGIVGRVIQTNGRPRTVIGVMPARFAFPAEADLYLPIAPNVANRSRRNLYWVSVVGRLKEGVTIAQAQTDLDAVTANIVQQFPRESGRTARVVGVHAWTVRNVRTALWVLLGAVGCVLLIACANLANLLLARGLVRRREIAVRVALGAGRERIVRQLLAESLLLAVGGGMFGLLLAQLALGVIKIVGAASLPSLAEIAINPVVLVMTAVICMCCGVGFGLAPAWQASRTDPHEALKESARTQSASRSTRLTRATLVVAQTALAMVLLVGAGLLLRSFWNLSQVETGIAGDQLVSMSLNLPGNRYSDSAKIAAFHENLAERLAAVPGVQRASFTTAILLNRLHSAATFTIEGRPNPPDEPRLELPRDVVSSDYFSTVGIPLVEGRAFNHGDAIGRPPVAIINETMARMFWPRESAIGRRFIFGDLPTSNADGTTRAPNWVTVVGVVKDTRRQGPDRAVRIESWFPMTQRPARSFFVVIRTGLPATNIAHLLRNAVWSIDKDIPVPRVEPVANLLNAQIAQRRLNVGLLTVFAALALVLAAVGLYGVLAYSVSQRTGEFGIRFALGARPRDVLELVFAQAGRLVATGLMLGLLLSFIVLRITESLLFGIKPHDAFTYAGVIVVLLATASVAAWLPARRAAKVDPMVALRCE
jgi:putative ABC transport system permease protein